MPSLKCWFTSSAVTEVLSQKLLVLPLLMYLLTRVAGSAIAEVSVGRCYCLCHCWMFVGRSYWFCHCWAFVAEASVDRRPIFCHHTCWQELVVLPLLMMKHSLKQQMHPLWIWNSFIIIYIIWHWASMISLLVGALSPVSNMSQRKCSEQQWSANLLWAQSTTWAGVSVLSSSGPLICFEPSQPHELA